jgi:trk system potassium uptake protein TrkH
MLAGLLLSLTMPGFDAAMVAAVSAFANIGPLYSPEWLIGPHWPAYSQMGIFNQLVLAATMILGRLEVIVLFAALNVAYWRS